MAFALALLSCCEDPKLNGRHLIQSGESLFEVQAPVLFHPVNNLGPGPQLLALTVKVGLAYWKRLQVSPFSNCFPRDANSLCDLRASDEVAVHI